MLAAKDLAMESVAQARFGPFDRDAADFGVDKQCSGF